MLKDNKMQDVPDPRGMRGGVVDFHLNNIVRRASNVRKATKLRICLGISIVLGTMPKIAVTGFNSIPDFRSAERV